MGCLSGKSEIQGQSGSNGMTEKKSDVRVFVDAKIKGMHDKALPKNAYVAYYIEGTGEHCERPVNADESDDAEIQAVLFAIEKLKDRFERMTIVCDHESVVSEANRELVKNPGPWLTQLRQVLHDSSSVRLTALQSNRAHKTLTEYVNWITKNIDSK